MARVSERTLDAPAVAVAPTGSDMEELDAHAEQIYSKLCRMMLHGIIAYGGDTPRSARAKSVREQYRHRKKWRLNRTRQPDELEEGLGGYSPRRIKAMAVV